MSRYISNHIRLATITGVDHSIGVIQTQWMDQGLETGPNVPIPHPFAGSGGEGIFIGPRAGSVIAIDSGPQGIHIPVAILPQNALYGGDLSGVGEAKFDDISYPDIKGGEIAIQGSTGSLLRLTNDGNILIENDSGEGTLLCGGSDESLRCAIHKLTPVNYTISPSGMHSVGIVRRDVRIEDGEDDFTDFLTNPASEQSLEEIGRNPKKQVIYISKNPSEVGITKSEGLELRNPAFVEDKRITLEFARQWNVGLYEEELQRLKEPLMVLREPEDRAERRSNIFGLSLTNPNELIESVSGTAVDIFGNLVDMNRHIIAAPEEENDDFLDSVVENSRHTIAFHMELNARKGWAYREGIGIKPTLMKAPPDVLTSANNARDRGRLSVDIDKEGLIKINAPASSETGNVPMPVRYETSSVIDLGIDGNVKATGREEDDNPRGIFRNEQNRDIVADQFGPGGITVLGLEIENRLNGKSTSWEDEDGKQSALGKFVQSGTAFHNITKTANILLEQSINKKSSDIFITSEVDADASAISSEIDARVPKKTVSAAQYNSESGKVKDQPNAGGRSAYINLDGSLEMSIGANTVDRVSWTLDTAGAIIARLGRDRHGRSAIVQTDGSVALEVGGFDFIGENSDDEVDTRFVGRGNQRLDSLPKDPRRFKSGKVVIRVRRANGNQDGPDNDDEDQIITIDENGISIDSIGRLNLSSTGDMTLKSDSRILLDGEIVQIFSSNPKFARRDGRTF